MSNLNNGTMDNEYKALLKDGRWQRKRLEIMLRDKFKCTECGTTNNLNVHHLRYIPGRAPWEYDNNDLVTLCGECHKQAHEKIERARQEAERERKEIEEYEDCLWRAKQLSGLFLYYEQIGDLHDVITAQETTSWDCYDDFDLWFYINDVRPYSPSWCFSRLCSANHITIGVKECKLIRDHVWLHEPDAILTKEEFGNVYEGLMTDKESYEGDEAYDWVLLKDFFDKSAKIYARIK